MVTAKFKTTFTGLKGKQVTAGCVVTLKDDEKISLTNKWGTFFPSDKYKFETIAKAAIKDGFKDPGFTEVKTILTADIEIISNLLKLHTQDTYKDFLERVKDSAGRAWDNASKYEVENREQYNRVTKIPYGSHSKEVGAFYKTFKKKTAILSSERNHHINRVERDAIQHYELSIRKLAHRVMDEGFDLPKLKVTQSRVSVNVDVVITDGTKTLKARTIIAEGEIIKAHYRYLIIK